MLYTQHTTFCSIGTRDKESTLSEQCQRRNYTSFCITSFTFNAYFEQWPSLERKQGVGNPSIRKAHS